MPHDTDDKIAELDRRAKMLAIVADCGNRGVQLIEAERHGIGSPFSVATALIELAVRVAACTDIASRVELADVMRRAGAEIEQSTHVH